MRFVSRASLPYLRISIFTVLVALWYFFRHPRASPTYNGPPDWDLILKSPTTSSACPNFPGTSNIGVAIKTGATEATEKIPALMQTRLRCLENVFFFSDLEQDIDSHHLYDALDTISEAFLNENQDFTFYRQQKTLWQRTQNITSLRGTKNPESPNVLAAWTLDKYKFIHIVEKTWALKPDLDWYLFLDADTYVVWPNMIHWLSTLDPNRKSYFGSEVSINDIAFAHGGSGIILSKALVYEIAVTRKGVAAQWDGRTKERCCGDLVLAEMMREFGTRLRDVWPLMSGERPESLPFGPGSGEYWCKPALTFHHVSVAGMKRFSDFEEAWWDRTKMPLRHADVLKELWLRDMTERRENWDNLAADKGEFGKTGGVKKVAATFEECKSACEGDEDCFQFSWHGGKCFVGRSVRFGEERIPDEGGEWTSGWSLTRLESWMGRQEGCDGVEWPGQR
ncbi:hypothetical protein GLAREA_05050 [Glarea lozoyensis ATCC 20868]|uniref:N-acetylgalactosaminide beta-1,3-galactosyltransferase n=1 Tax=Glarea lozoyensis (strain ATCC 20868 / MF5171) TaxID=1116229 RepID=S3EBN1_GLAL2|nr:uncharacterized protein GLAREA_05050 [Glarea lozoyensis ATCC 20868]EPE35713.1 hypothetical protein GLAREA_05050 [Glarea lozoyensis ATCC 20868]